MRSVVAQCAVFPVPAGQIRDEAISPAPGCRPTEVTSRFPGRSSWPGKGGGGGGRSPSRRGRTRRPGGRRVANASAACRERGGPSARGGGWPAAGAGWRLPQPQGAAGGGARASSRLLEGRPHPRTAARLPDPLRALARPPPACGKVGVEGRCNRTAEERGGWRKVWGPLGAGELYQRRDTVLIEGGTGQGAGSGRKSAWGREPLGICGTDPWVRKGLGPGGWRWG